MLRIHLQSIHQASSYDTLPLEMTRAQRLPASLLGSTVVLTGEIVAAVSGFLRQCRTGKPESTSGLSPSFTLQHLFQQVYRACNSSTAVVKLTALTNHYLHVLREHFPIQYSQPAALPKIGGPAAAEHRAYIPQG